MPAIRPGPTLKIALGFMAAKQLFAASEIGLFDALASGPADLEELPSKTSFRRVSRYCNRCDGQPRIGRPTKAFQRLGHPSAGCVLMRAPPVVHRSAKTSSRAPPARLSNSNQDPIVHAEFNEF